MLCNSFFFSDKHYSLLVSLLSIESQDRVKSVPRHWKIFWVHPKSVIETYLFCEKSTCVTPDQPRVKQCLKITMKLAKFLQKISKKLKATACSQLSWTCMNSNWCNHYDLKKNLEDFHQQEGRCCSNGQHRDPRQVQSCALFIAKNLAFLSS